jgi:replicative DNA helicase
VRIIIIDYLQLMNASGMAVAVTAAEIAATVVIK